MTRKRSILVPRSGTSATARFSVTIDADLLERLRDLERRAERAGFALPVTTLIEERIKEIVRDASRELSTLGLNPAASAPADAAAGEKENRDG